MTSLEQELLPIEDPSFYSDAWETFARLRRECPVYYYEPLDTFVLTKYEDIRFVSRQPAVFTSAEGVMLNHIRYPKESFRAFITDKAEVLMYTEPPRHRDLRRAFAPSFTPPAIAKMEEQMRRLSRGLIDAIEPGEPIPFVSRIGAVLPIMAIATLLGVPTTDVDRLRYWSDEKMKTGAVLSPDEFLTAAANVTGLDGYFNEWCMRKRNEESSELIPTMLRNKVAGEPITYETLHETLRSVLIAGNETTRDYLCGSVYAYAQHPEQHALLRAHPELGVNAAEECLRWVTPVRGHTRKVLQDTEIRGQSIRRGQHVWMVYMSGNRDEDVWEDADVFDISRDLLPMNVTFGFGEHSCLGAAVARLEGRVFFEELVQRFGRWELAGEPTLPPSAIHNAFEELPMAFYRD